MKNTYFLDLDGTLINHNNDNLALGNGDMLLPGVKEKLNQWILEDATIIITTGRRKSLRKKTVEQLRRLNIPYDKLIMGIGRGKRIVINDMKPNSEEPMALAYTMKRNEGLINCPY